jgi:hypothetical protein
MTVPARVILLLEDREIEALVQKPRASEPGDPGPNDGERLHDAAGAEC